MAEEIIMNEVEKNDTILPIIGLALLTAVVSFAGAKLFKKLFKKPAETEEVANINNVKAETKDTEKNE